LIEVEPTRLERRCDLPGGCLRDRKHERRVRRILQHLAAPTNHYSRVPDRMTQDDTYTSPCSIAIAYYSVRRGPRSGVARITIQLRFFGRHFCIFYDRPKSIPASIGHAFPQIESRAKL